VQILRFDSGLWFSVNIVTLQKIIKKECQRYGAYGWKLMIRMVLRACLFLVGLTGGLNAVAQDGSYSLSGYWKQERASVYIHVVDVDGIYEAEMIRNDWSPGLVGTKIFQNVVVSEKRTNRWSGESVDAASGRIGKASLRINRDGKLRSRLRPGGNAVWVRSGAIEKRY